LNLIKRKSFSRILLILLAVIGSILLLTGCVRGMSPIGWSGVLVSNGSLYTGSKEGKLVSVNLNTSPISVLSAEPLRAAPSGSSCSSTGIGGGTCGGSAPGIAIYGTPAMANVPVLGDLIFIAGYNGKIFAYDAKTLQQRWVYPVEGNLAPIVSTIAISGDMLYFGCTDFNLYALDTATGNLEWKFATGGEIWSSPVIDNNTVFISSFDKKIYAVDATTGTKKWEFSTSSTNVATPLTLDGVLYVGSLDRNLYAIDETTGQSIWKSPVSGGNWFWARPVALNGVIFAPNLDSKVYAVNAKTGNIQTTYDTGGPVASFPVVVNNEVIVATQNGKLLGLSGETANTTPRSIATIANNVVAPLSTDNDVVYINAPDNIIHGYNVVTGAQTTIALQSK
jgi:eukaryotic-like serine/threonine-protein kinase